MKSKLSNEMVIEKIKSHFGDAIRNVEEPYGFLTVEVEAAKIH